jgi:hypothetical protein
LGRTWDVGVAYDRQVGFVHTIAEPVFSDSVNASVGGLLGRRVQMQSSIGAISGSVGISESDRRYVAYQAAAGLSVAVNHYIAVRFDGVYYGYRSHADPLSIVALSRIDGRSISVGVDVFAPLFTRVSRRGNAAR